MTHHFYVSFSLTLLICCSIFIGLFLFPLLSIPLSSTRLYLSHKHFFISLVSPPPPPPPPLSLSILIDLDLRSFSSSISLCFSPYSNFLPLSLSHILFYSLFPQSVYLSTLSLSFFLSLILSYSLFLQSVYLSALSLSFFTSLILFSSIYLSFSPIYLFSPLLISLLSIYLSFSPFSIFFPLSLSLSLLPLSLFFSFNLCICIYSMREHFIITYQYDNETIIMLNTCTL